jgi:hypothetical protein
MRKIIATVVVLQLTIIGFILNNIYVKSSNKNNFGAVSVSPINRDNYSLASDSVFQYYWTYEPSVTEDNVRYWDGTSARYTYNQDGLNERLNYDIDRTDGVYRIITLGDSFTFGHYVDTKDNWTEILEEMLNKENVCTKLNKFEVINLGMPGFDVPYIVKRFHDLGIKYRPDMIIWFESGSGFTRNNELMEPYIQECLANLATPSSQLVAGKEQVKCWDNALEYMFDENNLERVKKDNREWKRTFFNIRGSTPVVFATFSFIPQVDKNSLENQAMGQDNVFFLHSISDINMAHGVFPDGHPNQKGHGTIASDIYNYLVTNKITFGMCD